MIFATIGNIISTYYLDILGGVGLTLLAALIGTIIGLLIGLLIGIYRTMPTPKNKFLRVLKKSATLYSIFISKFSAAHR